MSAAEHQSPDLSSQENGKPLNTPPQRPSLRQPPPRPERPAPPAADKVAAVSKTSPAEGKDAGKVIQSNSPTPEASEPAQPVATNHPIAPPSEPMQYRAIGLVKGVYQPSDEQLNRGDIITDDGVTIDSVLLGRVTSLIKKHIDLESSHLWVVYPRTRQPLEDSDEDHNESSLHLQIVGVWEPDTLGLPGENPNSKAEAEDEAESAGEAAVEAALPEAAEAAEEAAVPAENYFSIRGEVLNYDEDEEKILIKIVQGSKRSGKPPKAFKLHLFGKVTGKTLGYFWEFDVERQGEKLVMTEGRAIRMVPPKKKKGRSFEPRRGAPRGPGMTDRPKPSRNPDKPRIRPSAPVKSNPL